MGPTKASSIRILLSKKSAIAIGNKKSDITTLFFFF